MDDYTVLLYYEESSTDAGFYVMAPTNPFTTQANPTVQADLAWGSIPVNDANGGYIKKYLRSGTTYTELSINPVEFANIIKKRSGSGGQFHILIYDVDQLVNFFVGGSASLPSYVNTWPSLTVPYHKSGTGGPTIITGGKTFNFSALLTNDVEAVNSNTGSDNGYKRNSDGQCGTWVKSSSGSDHTPRNSNGPITSTGSLQVSAALSQAGPNVNALNLAYRVISTTKADVWPVQVRVVDDYGLLQDGNTNNGDETKLPETPTTPYNFADVELAVNPGSPDPSYKYPIDPVNAVMPASVSFKSSPVYTVGAYPVGYSGLRSPRAFHVFFQTASGCFDQVRYASFPGQIVLPVNFKNFTAKRNKDQVYLNWQTVSECNNAGFVVERNINGQWSEVTFVATKAPNGNSEAAIDYQYTDLNPHKGITQYRIRQNDVSDKTTYSVVRSVQGEGAASKVVIYPNPSFDGRVQIVFQDATSPRHVVVTDMSGRIVRQLNNVNNSSVVVDGLNAGLYTARVINQTTGESILQKFVIQQK